MSGLVAVTGASGHLGRLVARELSARGVRQRVVTRSPARTPLLDDAEVAIADYADVTAISDALDGVATLFLVSGHEARDRLDLHRGVVQAAARVGVRRVVYTSFMGAAPQASFTYARDHAHTERAIVDAGMALTALRDSLYADWAPLFVGEDGVIRGPAGNGTVAWVARADVIATGEVGVTSHTIEALTGRRPMAFDEFLRATPEAWAHLTGQPPTS